MIKKKLELKKQVIASLSNVEMGKVIGGEAYTTSNSECTHFICCETGCRTETCDETLKATECFECPTDPPACNTIGPQISCL